MYEYLLSCIVFHEKEYKDKLCCAASYIEIYMIYMCICVFFLSEVAIISKLYFNLLDRSFVLITIQFDIINFFLIYSNTILKNSMHIALTKSIFFFGQIHVVLQAYITIQLVHHRHLLAALGTLFIISTKIYIILYIIVDVEKKRVYIYILYIFNINLLKYQ